MAGGESAVFSGPVLTNLTGSWKPEPEDGESDPIGPMLEAMGVNWLFARIAASADVTYHYRHMPTRFTTEDRSGWGSLERKYVLDGSWRLEEKSKSRCRAWEGEHGEVVTEVMLDGRHGVLRETRQLRSRTELVHMMELHRGGSIAHRCKRIYHRIESEAERAAGERAEARARVRLEEEAARLGFSLSMGGGVGIVGNVGGGEGAGREGGWIGCGKSLPRDGEFHLTGIWNVDRSRSDRLAPLLEALGVPWVARGIAESVDVTAHILHAPGCSVDAVEAEKAAVLVAAAGETLGASRAARMPLWVGDGVDGKGEERSEGGGEGEGSGGGRGGGGGGTWTTLQSVLLCKDESSFGVSESATVTDGCARLQKSEDGKRLVIRAWQIPPSHNPATAQPQLQWCACAGTTLVLQGAAPGSVVVEVVLGDGKGVTVDERRMDGEDLVQTTRIFARTDGTSLELGMDGASEPKPGAWFVTKPAACVRRVLTNNAKGKRLRSDALSTPSASTPTTSKHPSPSPSPIPLPSPSPPTTSSPSSSPTSSTPFHPPASLVASTGAMSGEWIVDHGRSESLEPLLRGMGAGSFIASWAAGVSVTYSILHTPIKLVLTEKSALGGVEQEFILDGEWRLTPMHTGSPQPAKAREHESTGEVIIEVMLPGSSAGKLGKKRGERKGVLDASTEEGESTHSMDLIPPPGQDPRCKGRKVLVDHRSLADRSTLRQALTLVDEDGKPLVTCARVLVRIESDAERAAAEAALQRREQVRAKYEKASAERATDSPPPPTTPTLPTTILPKKEDATPAFHTLITLAPMFTLLALITILLLAMLPLHSPPPLWILLLAAFLPFLLLLATLHLHTHSSTKKEKKEQ